MGKLPQKELVIEADVKGRGEQTFKLPLRTESLLASLLTAAALFVAQYLGYADIEAVQLFLGTVSS